MSVINQVLQDLDARKTGRHGEDPVWAIEPPAIAEPPRRIPALTLTVPVVAIAVAALFGQGSWGWQTPDATARHSIGPTMAAGTADAAATTRGMIAGVPLPGSSASPGSAPGATPMTIAALRAFEPVDYLPDPSPRADGANRSTATAPDAASAAAAVPATAPIAPIPAVANVTNGGPALAWLTSPSPTDVPAASPTATAVASRSPSAAATTTTPVASTAALASLAPPAQVSTPHGPGAASRATMPAASTTSATPQIERTSLGPIATGRADGHFRNAMLRYHAGQLDEAARLLQAALADDPRHSASRQALAAMLIDRRDYSRAQAVLLEGLAVDPTQSAFATMAARLFVRQGDLDAAARTLQAAAGERAAPELQATLADVLSRLRRDSEALVHWNSALQRSPAHAGWWLGLAVSLEGAGRAHDARTAYERALSLPGLKADAADYARERLAGSR